MDLVELLGTSTAELASHPAFLGRRLAVERFDERLHVEAPESGFEVVDHGDGLIGTIHLHCRPGDGFAAFAGELPCGLAPTMTRAEVRRLLGEPEWSGEALTFAALGSMPPWDRFVLDEGYVHVSYSDDDSGLSLVTVMARAAAPSPPTPG